MEANGEAFSNTRRRPSYRRNRDYSKKVNWTYELNNALYTCYKGCEPDKPNYSERLKKIWDQVKPMYSYMTKKHLAEQVRRIKNKNLVMHETLCKKSKDDTNNTGLQREANMAAENTNSRPDEEDYDRDISTSTENDNIVMNDITAQEGRENRDFTTNIENESITSDTTTVKQRKQHTVPDIDQERLENMKARWSENYDKYKDKPLHEREFLTKTDRNIPENDLKIVDKLVKDFIEENLQKDGLSLWDLNVICYTSAVTILDNLGRLKTKKNTYTYRKPGWQIQAETRISSLRKKLSLIDVVQKCKSNDSYTKHQRNIERKLKKWYGSTKKEILQSKKVDLKQQLTSECEKLRRRKEIEERKRINYQFKVNPKQVYRKFEGESNIDITNAPGKDKVKEFWSNIWGKPRSFNNDAEWLKTLREEYCKHVTPKAYDIDLEKFRALLKNMQNNKAPGIDMIVMFWWKKLESLHCPLVRFFIKFYKNQLEVPQWLTVVRTTLQPKNKDTHKAKNYRPIACENTMLKLYTGILASFITDHCIENNIITREQTGGKKDSWGCSEQLLINKTATEECKNNRRNLICIWLDYKKTFDSIPHDWITEALKLAKVPDIIIEAVRQLMSAWATKVFLNTDKEQIETDEIKYLNGILQGDLLSLILFILSVNPLSFLLERCDG